MAKNEEKKDEESKDEIPINLEIYSIEKPIHWINSYKIKKIENLLSTIK